MNKSKYLRNILNHVISVVSNSPSLFSVNPKSDFTRNRKLSFETVIKNVICMEAGSLKDELLKLNDYSSFTPTSSAFVQARSKIKHDAFKTIFDTFNQKSLVTKTLKGYRLLAIDGTVLPIDNSFADEETTLQKINNSDKTFSAFHLNASYDLLECTYDDLVIQGQANFDENGAFVQLVDQYKGNKAIFIADRGYESFNGVEHVSHSENKYLIRVKDIHSKTSIMKSFGSLPNNELWHGAAWNFILWGLYYFILLYLEKTILKEPLKKLPNAVKYILTFIIVNIGWLLFRVNDLADAGTVLKGIVTNQGEIGLTGLCNENPAVIFALIFCIVAPLFMTDLGHKIHQRYEKQAWYQLIRKGTLMGIFVICIMFLVSSTYNPFIYFRF